MSLADRPLSSIGYPPIADLAGSEDGSLDVAWLTDVVVVFDGPRLLVTSPAGFVGRPTGYHAVLDSQERWWALTVTRSGTLCHAWREGPFGDLDAVAEALRRPALSSEWGSLPHRLPISAEHIQRALDQHPVNSSGWSDGEAADKARLRAAFDRFLDEHSRYGGW